MNDSTDAAPRATVGPAASRRLSVAWLVPIAALAVVIAVGWQAWTSRGVPITIAFDEVDGLVEGDRIVFRGVTVGVVREIGLDPSSSQPIVQAELQQDARLLAREGSRWWVVRPRVSLSQVAGLETLVGPRYIEVSPGPADASPRTVFEGLSGPPARPSDGSPPARFVLRTPDATGLGVGALVQYRGVEIGRVTELRLASDARAAEVAITIDHAFTPLVRVDSRFWSSGGAGLDFGWLSGLSLRADSLQSVVSGGISMATPDSTSELAPDGTVFELASEPGRDWRRWSPSIPLEEPPAAP